MAWLQPAATLEANTSLEESMSGGGHGAGGYGASGRAAHQGGGTAIEEIDDDELHGGMGCDSGWAIAEACATAILKPPCRRLDISRLLLPGTLAGMLPSSPPTQHRRIDEWSGGAAVVISEACDGEVLEAASPSAELRSGRLLCDELVPQLIARRGPPALPSQLAAALLDRERCAFAQADDAEIAISLYTDLFYAAARGVQSLDYSKLGWTGAHACSVAYTPPLTRRRLYIAYTLPLTCSLHAAAYMLPLTCCRLHAAAYICAAVADVGALDDSPATYVQSRLVCTPLCTPLRISLCTRQLPTTYAAPAAHALAVHRSRRAGTSPPRLPDALPSLPHARRVGQPCPRRGGWRGTRAHAQPAALQRDAA